MMRLELISGESYIVKNYFTPRMFFKELNKKGYIEILTDIEEGYISVPRECITPENKHMYTGNYTKYDVKIIIIKENIKLIEIC